MNSSELQKQFYKETGTEVINSQGEFDIDYVAWLEKKLSEVVEQPKTEAYICPVCNGKQSVPWGFYLPDGTITSVIGKTEPCKSCDGSGVLYPKFIIGSDSGDYVLNNGYTNTVMAVSSIDKPEIENKECPLFVADTSRGSDIGYCANCGDPKWIHKNF